MLSRRVCRRFAAKALEITRLLSTDCLSGFYSEMYAVLSARKIFHTIRMISLGIFGIDPVVFAIVALFTGVALVGLALWIAKLISPRSYNVQKGEAYECGIPTRGASMTRFHVGYYLFAILFLMFDVETVFLFPWAVRMKALGGDALICVAVFFAILVLGLVYAWRKGALEWK